MRFLPRGPRNKDPYSPIRRGFMTKEKRSLSESPVLDIKAGGHRLRAVSYGPGPKNTVSLVFLHEGLGSIAQWRDFPDRIAVAAECAVVVYERQGHGGSEPLTGKRSPDYHTIEARDVLPDVLDAFGVEKAILFGHSDGATIALLFAGLYPDRTLGVIAEAPHVFLEDISVNGIRAAKEAFETGNLMGRLETYHGDNTETMFSAWADTWLNPAFRNWSVEDKLPAIKAPVLLVQGEDDEYGTSEQLRRIEAGVGGDAETLLIPGCGHSPHAEKREEVFEATLHFIRRCAPAVRAGVSEDGT